LDIIVVCIEYIIIYRLSSKFIVWHVHDMRKWPLEFIVCMGNRIWTPTQTVPRFTHGK